MTTIDSQSSFLDPEMIGCSLDQAAQITSLSKSLLRKEIAAGRLKAKTVRRRVVITRAALIDYINRESKDWTPMAERAAA